MFFRNTCFKEQLSVATSVGRENVLALIISKLSEISLEVEP